MLQTLSRHYLYWNSKISKIDNLNFVLNPEGLDEDGRRRLELAVAFSHFTYDITDGYLLVCDLQGVCVIDLKRKETLLLTDPAIHCSKLLRFGKTNLGNLGIDKFFQKHVCNKYCHALGLKNNAKWMIYCTWWSWFECSVIDPIFIAICYSPNHARKRTFNFLRINFKYLVKSAKCLWFQYVKLPTRLFSCCLCKRVTPRKIDL